MPAPLAVNSKPTSGQGVGVVQVEDWGMPAPLAVNSKPAWAKEEGNQLGSHLRGNSATRRDDPLVHAVQVLPSLRASRHPLLYI
jgi:hypothetical protein